MWQNLFSEIISVFSKLLYILNMNNWKKTDTVRKEPKVKAFHKKCISDVILRDYEIFFKYPAVVYGTYYYIFYGETSLDKIIDSESFQKKVDYLSERLSESSYDYRFTYFGLIAVLRQSCTFKFNDGRKEAIDELIYAGIIRWIGGYDYIALMSLNGYFEYINTYNPLEDPYIALKEAEYVRKYNEEYFYKKL